MGTKESVYIRKEINSHKIGLEHQHGRRFIVLEHQYGCRDVMWKRSRSNRVTRNALATSNNEAYGQANGRQSFRIVLLYLDKGRNFFIGRFHTRADYLSDGCPVDSRHTGTPSSIFSEGRGRLYTGYLKRIIWTDKLSVKIDG